MLKNRILPLSLFALLVGIEAFGAERRALLIGIDDYTASQLGTPRVPRTERDWADLSGAVNDVRTLRQMLVLLYGFREKDIIALEDQSATRTAILRSLEEHLVKPAAKGDVVLFYYAGHGSQVRNSLSEEADSLDESLVPADSRLGVPDIRDKELRTFFNAILDKGAQLTVVLDHCHSGSGARGLSTGARPRAIKADPRDVKDGAALPRPEDRGALVLSAAQDFDQAWETRDETGAFHGAFSWALIRAMRDSSAGESASETFLRARARMRGETPFQEPVMAGTSASRLAPLLGARTDRRGERPVVFVEKVQRDGTVSVQGGWAHGLSVGTELRAVSDRAVKPRLKITALTGLGRSRARIEAGGPVASGSMLEVVGWAVPAGRPLRVWAPRVSGDAGAVAAMARKIFAEASRRGVRWILDPTEVTPAHLLRRTSERWELLSNGAVAERVGVEPADAVARLPRGSTLFVQFPVPASMLDGIATAGQGIERVGCAAEADYVLLARYASRRMELAWVRPAVTAADKLKSGLPVRTDWIAEDGRAALRDALHRLRRIHAWQTLQSPPFGRSPYRLELRRARDGEIARNVLVGDDVYDVVLRSATPGVQRYVYVFVIDSFGASTLLFPRSGSVENRLPLALPAPPEIRLGRESSFEVAPPYGVDTFFLITSDEPLANPWILEWAGVRTRAPVSRTTPSWTIERLVLESIPPRRHKAASGVSQNTRESRMAEYKYRERLHPSTSAAFDTRHAPGTIAQNPGIYRCPGCGDEIAIAKGHTLPPQNHHQHAAHQGKVEWQLLVFAEQSR